MGANVWCSVPLLSAGPSKSMTRLHIYTALKRASLAGASILLQVPSCQAPGANAATVTCSSEMHALLLYLCCTVGTTQRKLLRAAASVVCTYKVFCSSVPADRRRFLRSPPPCPRIPGKNALLFRWQSFLLLRKDKCNFFRDVDPSTAQEIRRIMVSMVSDWEEKEPQTVAVSNTDAAFGTSLL